MKHLLYSALVAVIMLAFAACSNDDIPIQRIGDISVKVGTSSLYQNFGKDAYQNLLGSNKNLQVQVRLLCYNHEGTLVSELTHESNTFGEEVFTVNDLPQGEYTVVALQTLIDKSYEPKEGEISKWWKLDSKEKLSTLRVDRVYSNTAWHGALGWEKSVLRLTGKTTTCTLNPKPIGYLVDFNYENTANTNYVAINFYYHNLIKGIYVNENKPYEANYNDKNTWTPISNTYRSSGVGENGGSTSFCINTGEQLVGFGAANATQHANNKFILFPKNGQSKTFQAGKNYVAYAIYDPNFEDNFAYCVGEKDEVDRWYQKYIEQATTYFMPPCTNWETTVSNVKASMSGYTMGNANGEVTEQGDGSYLLWYYGKNKEEEIDYYFSNSTSGLYRSYVFMNPSVVSEVELNAYIQKMGYNFLGKLDDGGYVYESADKSTCVQFGLNTEDIWYICFFDPNSSLNVAPRASIKRMANRR